MFKQQQISNIVLSFKLIKNKTFTKQLKFLFFSHINFFIEERRQLSREAKQRDDLAELEQDYSTFIEVSEKTEENSE